MTNSTREGAYDSDESGWWCDRCKQHNSPIREVCVWCIERFGKEAVLHTRTTKNLTFETLRQVNLRRCINDFKHPLESWSPLEWAGAVCGEAGEAANVAKKMIRLRDGVAGNKGEDLDPNILRKKLLKEIADAVIYADLVATSQGMSLEEVLIEVFNAKSEEIGSPERL